MVLLLWFLLVVLAVSVAAIAVRIWAYGRRLRYNPRSDYAYTFLTQDAEEHQVQLGRDGFLWPDVSGPWDTAVLELHLGSTVLGQIMDPFVEHNVAGESAKQFFERGCRGLRCLNLVCAVPGRVAKGDFISLRGGFAKWSLQPSRLKMFNLKMNQNDPVLVVAPHPDDAEIAAFGLYASHPSTVVTVTRGEKGSRSYLGLPSMTAHEAMRGKIRSWESRSVPLLGGVESGNSSNLGYGDSTLTGLFLERGPHPNQPVPAGHPPDGFTADSNISIQKPVAPSWDNLVQDLARAIRDTRPKFIVTPHPLIDRNLDHRCSTLAVLTALDRLGVTDGNLLLYVTHSALTNLYPHGQHGAVLGPPPWFESNVPAAGCHSFALEDEIWLTKYFALESMSDLRPAVNGAVAKWPDLVRWFVRQSFAKFAGILLPEDVQLARARFRNEWFLVMPFSSAKELMACGQAALSNTNETRH